MVMGRLSRRWAWSPGVLRSVGQALSWSAGCGDRRDPGERGGDLVGPGPAGGDAQPAAALAAGQAGGGVQNAVAQPFRLSLGEVAVEGEDLQPGDQVRGDRGGDAPGLVDGELARR